MNVFSRIVVIPLILMALVTHAAALMPLPDQEMRLWQRAAAEQSKFEQRCTLLKHRQLAGTINTVLLRLWPHVQTELAPMTVKVIQDPELTAETYPNGVCYVSTGMLVQLRNEDQLAMVLAHEMIHYVRRHALSAMHHLLGAGNPVKESQNNSHTHSILESVGDMDRFRHKSENEADREGLRLIQQAGFDPVRIIALLEGFPKLANATPASRDRRMMIPLILENAAQPVNGGNCCAYDPAYQTKVSAALLANAQMSIQRGLWDQAKQNLIDYIAVCPDDPTAHFLKGELQRRLPSGGKVENAMRAYEEAIRLDKAFAPAYRELGVAHFKMGRTKTARDYFETYLALAPQAEGSQFIRGYLKLCCD